MHTQLLGAAALATLTGMALMISACGGGTDSDRSSGSAVQAIRSDAWPLSDLNSQNLWTVTAATGLNCRTDASVRAPIVYEALPAGTLLRAIDLIGTRGTDFESYRWMKVLPVESADHTPCYAAAHRPFMQKVISDEVNWGSIYSIEGDVSCPTTFQNTVNVVQLTTQNYLIYLCADSHAPSKIRYYVAYDRSSSEPGPSLTLFAQRYNPDQGAYLEFYNQGYTYRIHKPSNFIKSPNMNIMYPDGRGYNEAILQWLD